MGSSASLSRRRPRVRSEALVAGTPGDTFFDRACKLSCYIELLLASDVMAHAPAARESFSAGMFIPPTTLTTAADHKY